MKKSKCNFCIAFLNCIKWIKTILILKISFIVFFTIFLLLLLFSYLTNSPKGLDIFISCQDINKDSIQILDSIKIIPDSITLAEHNNTLFTYLSKRESSFMERNTSISESRRNSLTIFFGILAALIAISYSNEKIKKSASIIQFFLLISIIGFYMLDVQYEYDGLKTELLLSANGNAIYKIVNSEPDYKIWYKINFISTDNFYNKIESNALKRIITKFKLAMQPKWERILYFIFPWFFISCLLLKQHCKKNQKKVE